MSIFRSKKDKVIDNLLKDRLAVYDEIIKSVMPLLSELLEKYTQVMIRFDKLESKLKDTK